ncbi:hypothetical protein H7K32_15230 [Brevibacillus agri]|uniref:hypothetical protein n=1 Tax=Brevibacillus agri TaxID=51101 RepID=UPI001C8EE943|nr:hypothetical protein [Brevibacillus agri]MBY0053002.1 hypothetical protein [Brevibacillus agri]
MNTEFFTKVFSMTDLGALELLRDELARKAASQDITWETRMAIYNNIQIIIERIMQLE